MAQTLGVGEEKISVCPLTVTLAASLRRLQNSEETMFFIYLCRAHNSPLWEQQLLALGSCVTNEMADSHSELGSP